MTSTFINLPPPPSDPVTPSEVPGTPNSGTTSLSALSTVAIKDGHQGQHPAHHHHHSTGNPALTSSNASTTTLDAERADRISRLAGLERVSTVRHAPLPHSGAQSSSSLAGNPGTGGQQTPIGYFDAAGNPVLAKERSTVGSASATGSAGGRTTWASGSDAYDGDKMSVSEITDGDVPDASEAAEAGSQGGLSDEGNASLVGFGEGAGSVVDGPISRGPGVIGQRRFDGELDRAPGSAQGTPAPRHAGLSGRETTERIVQERYAAVHGGDVQMGGTN